MPSSGSTDLLYSEGKLGEEAVLVEDYIDGFEYAVDGLVNQGALAGPGYF